MGAESDNTRGGEHGEHDRANFLRCRAGCPVNVAIDGPPVHNGSRARKSTITRFGQLELSCAKLHEDNICATDPADHLSQGQIKTGFPT